MTPPAGTAAAAAGKQSPAGRLYFVQWCPTCGRTLRTLVSLLGKQVACHHCRSVFQASAAEGAGGGGCRPANLRRAEQLLAQFEPAAGGSATISHPANGNRSERRPLAAKLRRW